MILTYRKGDKGQEVARAQEAIGGLKIDGDFGPKTDKAVRDYQASNSLVSDGIVGPATRNQLKINIYPGIDISHWNGKIKWDTVEKEQIAYVWTKITEGKTFKDSRRLDNIVGCRLNGIPVGGYHFGHPENNSPKEEIEHFLNSYGGDILDKDLTPVLDLEAGKKGDPEHNRQWAIEFLEELEKEIGRAPLVYTGKWYIKSYLGGNVKGLEKYPLWIADYTKTRNEPDYIASWDQWSIWQWTSRGQVAGLDKAGIKRVDRNWLSGGPEALASLTKATCP